jgi:enterochelin esterase family protein
MTAVSVSGPTVEGRTVTFVLADPNRRLVSVHLFADAVAADRRAFSYDGGAWLLRLSLTDVWRLEYLLELEHPSTRRELILDPRNPLRAPGAFGEKSVVELGDYRRPAWLDAPAVESVRQPLEIWCGGIAATIRGEFWQPAVLQADLPAPLLVVHDGPEFDALARFTQWAAAAVAAGDLPPMRVALLAPGDRNRWYAADPGYARALTQDVLGSLSSTARVSQVIGVGASLGALALLHAHRCCPGAFDGLFLQSGSFFTPDLDPQERRFARFEPITRFTAELEQAITDADPVAVGMTCGVAEENLANNQRMASVLDRLGYRCTLTVNPDVHNFTAWRDAWVPSLPALITAVGEGLS